MNDHGHNVPLRAAGPLSASAIMVVVCWVGPACEPRPRPWQSQPDGAVVDESSPFLPARRDASSWLADAGITAADAGQPPNLPSLSAKTRVGGLWVRCYASFRPSSTARRDVHRLGLMCGPPNGMQRHGATFEGTAAVPPPGQSGPVTVGLHKMKARSGECYRVFAVADGVDDLDVRVLSSRGSRLAEDQTDDRWPIVDPDRPFCTFEDDKFTIEVTTPKGSAHYALQVWRLPPKRPASRR